MSIQNHSVDVARSLRSPENAALRREMLHAPHLAPLRKYVTALRNLHPKREFPDFDPLDGGCNADVLFLLEKPGRMTSIAGAGSGFISRNNDDPTAEAIFEFMIKAGLPRERTVIWNVVGGWNGTRKVTSRELRQGVEDLKGLIPLLPSLRTIVLVGQKAHRSKAHIESQPTFSNIQIYCSAHPSPIVRATQNELWKTIPSIWAKARNY